MWKEPKKRVYSANNSENDTLQCILHLDGILVQSVRIRTVCDIFWHLIFTRTGAW